MRFFNRLGVKILDKESKYIIKRLDVNKDGKVTISDLNIFFPQSKESEMIWQETLSSQAFDNTKLHNINIKASFLNSKENFPKDYLKEVHKISNDLNFVSPIKSNLNRNSKFNNTSNNNNNNNNNNKNKNNMTQLNNSTYSTHSNHNLNKENNKNPYFNNMTNILNEELIIKYFVDIINKDSEIDRARQELSLKPDFNFVDAFKFFENPKNKGVLDCNDIKRGYKCFGMRPNNDQILLIFQRYSKNKNYLE